MPRVYEIFTDLSPLQLTELASETFQMWLRFALGQQELNGKRLVHASGRYASAISWRRIGMTRVAIIADEDAIPEVGAIEYGRPAVDIKAHMLFRGGRVSKEGYAYRVIPLRPDQWRPTPTLTQGMLVNTLAGGRVRRGIGRMWAVPKPYIDKNSRFRTMSNRPGSSPWIVPEFHPYAPGKFLADLIEETWGR